MSETAARPSVLLVDDSAQNLSLMRELLRALYRVRACIRAGHEEFHARALRHADAT